MFSAEEEGREGEKGQGGERKRRGMIGSQGGSKNGIMQRPCDLSRAQGPRTPEEKE